MKHRKIVALALALLMLTAMFAGCKETEDGATTTTPTSAPTGSAETSSPTQEPDDSLYPIVEDKVTLTCMNYLYAPATGGLVSSYDEVQIYQIAEEITNVHIDFTTVGTEAYGNSVAITVASDDYPDIEQKWMQFSGNSAAQMVEDEILIDLAPLLEDYFPNLMSLLEEYPDALPDMLTDEGYLASTYSLAAISTYYQSGFVARQDLLDEMGLDAPETLDEMHDVLLAAKTKYDMEMPFQLSNYGINSDIASSFDTRLATITPATGNDGRAFYQDNGEVKFGWLDDSLTDYLTMLNQWYNEGLIARDLLITSDLTTNEQAQGARTNGNDTLIFDTGVAQFDSYTLTARNENPNYTLTPMVNPTLTEGQTLNFSGLRLCAYSTEAYGVTTGCENIEVACRWLDFWYSAEGIMMSNFGIEDLSYEYDVNGELTWTEMVLSPAEGMISRHYISAYTNLANPTLVYDNRELLTASPEAAECTEVWGTNKTQAKQLPSSLSLTASEGDTIRNLYADIETMITEDIMKFIVGERPLSEVADFQAQIRAMDIDICIAIMQDAYERYLAR